KGRWYSTATPSPPDWAPALRPSSLVGKSAATAPRGSSSASRRLRRPGLEELDGVARWILDEDLMTTGSLDDLAPEARPVGSETVDGPLEIVDDDLEAIPPAGRRNATGLARAAHARLVEKQSQAIFRQAREARGTGKVDSKAEAIAVEVDRLVDVCHEVPHGRLRHARQCKCRSSSARACAP